MKLAEIAIDNFRTFRNQTTIDLTDTYTGQTNNRIIFVGTNASGKTTLLETIVSLIKAFYGEEDELFQYLVSEANGASITFSSEDDSRFGLSLNKNKLSKKGQGEIPYFIYFPGNRSFNFETVSNKLDPTWGYEYSFHSDLIKDRLQSGLGELSSKFFAGRTLAISDSGFTLTASENNPKAIPLNKIPAGEKQALILLTIIDKYLKPNSIVIIDEFELSLHPTAQRRLFYLLSEKLLETNSQLIIATHSIEIVRLAKETEVFSLDEICGGVR